MEVVGRFAGGIKEGWVGVVRLFANFRSVKLGEASNSSPDDRAAVQFFGSGSSVWLARIHAPIGAAQSDKPWDWPTLIGPTLWLIDKTSSHFPCTK